MNNLYLIKTIVELVVIVLAYIVVRGFDERIEVLEKRETVTFKALNTTTGKVQDISFKKKIKNEEKKLQGYNWDADTRKTAKKVGDMIRKNEARELKIK